MVRTGKMNTQSTEIVRRDGEYRNPDCDGSRVTGEHDTWIALPLLQ